MPFILFCCPFTFPPYTPCPHPHPVIYYPSLVVVLTCLHTPTIPIFFPTPCFPRHWRRTWEGDRRLMAPAASPCATTVCHLWDLVLFPPTPPFECDIATFLVTPAPTCCHSHHSGGQEEWMVCHPIVCPWQPQLLWCCCHSQACGPSRHAHQP